jgi:D-glycero-D-manno-heptose 1,7-bisphosphate phosphatase
MILRAAEEHGIDLSRSFLIGDQPSDMEAAKRAGICGVTFAGGDLDVFVRDLLGH